MHSPPPFRTSSSPANNLFFLSMFFSESSDVLRHLEKIKPVLQGPSSSENLQLSSWNVSTPPYLWHGLQWTYSTTGSAPLPCHEATVRSNRSLATDLSLALFSLSLLLSSNTFTALSWPPLANTSSSLQVIDLKANRLGGPFPEWLADVSSLTVLDLSSNAFSDALPLAIRRLSTLEELRVRGNSMAGPIPPEIA